MYGTLDVINAQAYDFVKNNIQNINLYSIEQVKKLEEENRKNVEDFKNHTGITGKDVLEFKEKLKI